MHMIDIRHLTKDYGNGRGVFDISFHAEKGDVLGFLGPNGAGKTTTIRQLMGFLKPDSGTARILDMDCFKDAHKIAASLGYLPGEISFMDSMTGNEFLRFISRMKGMQDLGRAPELAERFELDTSARIRKMSKGTKQKLGILCAFMQSPDILLLDEPTSGLDPLMQNEFIGLIQEEKKKGRTILLSSHIFEEVERTCDRAVIIREGKLVSVEDIDDLRHHKGKIVQIRFADGKDAERFAKSVPGATVKDGRAIAKVTGSMDALIKSASSYTVEDIDIRTETLEEIFLHFYGGNEND